jgi:HlyD family secretion protein
MGTSVAEKGTLAHGGVNAKRRLIAVVVIALAAAGVWAYRTRTASRPAAETIRTARVTRGNLSVSVTATGSVQPYSQVEVRSRATGTVVEVHVQEGDRVRQGQLLLDIDDRDARAGYETAQASLAAARARLEQSRATLASTQAQNRTRIAQAEAALATARARLRQLTAGTRPEQLDQAREAVHQAEVNLSLARQNLDRVRTLFADGMVPRAQLEQAQSQFDVAQAQVGAAQARLRELQTGSTREEIAVARAQVREAEAAVAQARAALLQERVLAADVDAASAQVRNAAAGAQQARDRLRETQVSAPIAGIVSKLSVQVGQTVIGGVSSGGTLVMMLADTRIIQASVMVDETDIARIKPDMSVRVTADALRGRTFAGRVRRIAPQSQVVQNVTQYEVIVAIENPDQALRLGMGVDAEFVVTARQNVLLVPVEAVRGHDARVVILVEGETLRPVVVETGATDGRQVEIVKGLEAGQTVYLGPSRQPGGTTNSRPQQVNPFLPQFRRTPGR